jgi:hypothetical protein
MFGTLFYILISVWLCLIFVVTSTFFTLGVLGLFRSPHRSKLFFSYSHKDTEIAQKIMKRFAVYRFKIWIDLGIEIPTDKLEKELGKAVEGCEIFILLASVHSQGSNWVQFEIDQAKKMPELPEFRVRRFTERFTEPPTGRFRDTIILSLDDWGSMAYEEIKELQEELLAEYSLGIEDIDWAEELSDLPPALYRTLVLLVKGVRKIINPNPSILRIVKPTVVLFDLSNDFESVMQQLAQHLSNSTQLLRSQSKGLMSARIMMLLLYGFVMLLSGFLLLGRLTG